MDDAGPQPLAPESRLGLLILAGSLLVIGAPLVLLPARTEDVFSWTIEPPLTAAWLGAGYWGSFVLVLLCARQAFWTHARVAMPGIIVAGVFLLLATFIHLDRFHMDAVTGWAWLILYALLPPGAAVLVLRQRRLPGGGGPRTAPMPRWAVVALAAQGAVLLVVGAALFVAPADAASLWSWTLTPLTGRAIGAWSLAIGASALQAAWEADWDRIRAGMLGYAAIAVLALLALVRFADTPDPGAALWLLLLFLAVMLATGLGAALTGRTPAAAVSPEPAARR